MRKIFLDCGAWEGNSIGHFRELYHDNKEYEIFCFEPNIDLLEKLKHNVERGKVIAKAIWVEDCERTLRVGKGRFSESSSLIKKKKIRQHKPEYNQRVECVDFSKWITKHCSPDDYIVCKLNIEGAEYKVIEHLVETGAINHINELYVEWHQKKIGITEDEHNRVIKLIPKTIKLKQWELDHCKNVVYTTIFGKGYGLNEPKRITANWDYVCFTDNEKLESNFWDIRYIPLNNGDPRKLSRKIKILNDVYLPGYAVSIFLDARFTIKDNLDKFVGNNLKHDMAVMRHNRRSCLFKEAEYLQEKGKLNAEDKKLLSRQIRRYRVKHVPENLGLWAPGIMIRKQNNSRIRDMMRLWYEEMMGYSHRDIVSFAFAKYKHSSVNIDEMNFKTTYKRFMAK